MEAVNITANERTRIGSAAAKVVRSEGKVPAVIYSDGDAIHISVDPKDIKPLVYTPKFKVAQIEAKGSNYKCILKDVQFHPQTDEILHVDFQQLIDGVSIKVQVPVELNGIAEGVKGGGKLYQKLRKVKIKTTAENLIDKVSLDVSHLLLGDSVRIRDIADLDGVQIMNASGIPIASVETPRALRSIQAEEAELEEGEEGEEGEGVEGEGGEGESSEGEGGGEE